MKKILIFLFIGIFLISLTSALNTTAQATMNNTHNALANVESGWSIVPLSNVFLTSVYFNTSISTAYKVYVRNATALLGNETAVGGVATFSSIPLLVGVPYNITVTNLTSTWKTSDSLTYTMPYNDTYITVTGTIQNDGKFYTGASTAWYGVQEINYTLSPGADKVVSLSSPANSSVFTTDGNNFTAIFNISTPNTENYNWSNATYNVWYSNSTIFNQTTVSLSGNQTQNTLFIDSFEFGNYLWNVQGCYTNGTNSNCTYATSNYTFQFAPFNITNVSYTQSVLETSHKTFTINITTISDVSSVTGRFWYNGTSQTANITDQGSGIYSSSDSLDIPLQLSSGNKFFFWDFNFVLTDGSTLNQNTSSYNQEVNKTVLTICNSTITTQFVNFTTKNAENPFPILNATFKSAWEWWLGSGTVKRNYSFEDITETNSTFNFCLDYNKTFYTNAHIEYDGTDYALNSYYLENASISNVTTPISLYLLNSSKSTITTLKVRDSIQAPKPNVLVYIQLYDVGTDSYHTVAMAKTSFAGQDIAYLNWYDSLYKFILVENGTTIKTTDPYRISSTPQIFDIKDSIAFTFDKFKDFEYSLTFNNVTKNFVLTFVKPSGLVDEGCLRVSQINGTTETQLSLVCETSSSATLYYNINSSGNGTFVATFYATGSYSLIDRLTINIGGSFSQEIFNLLGEDDASAYAILFAGIVVAMFIVTPVLGVVGIILGILGASALGFTVLDYGIFAGVVIVGGIIIWLIKR